MRLNDLYENMINFLTSMVNQLKIGNIFSILNSNELYVTTAFMLGFFNIS